MRPTPLPRLTRANIMLADQYARLSAVIAGPVPREVRSLAEHYLAKVRYWMSQPEAARDLCLGELGENQYGPSIDAVCAQAQFLVVRSTLQEKDLAA
jgi:hypothetical protein